MEEKFDEINAPAEQPSAEPVTEAAEIPAETAEAPEAEAAPACEPTAEGDTPDGEAQTEEATEAEAALPPVQLEPAWGAPVQERRRLGLAGFFAIFGKICDFLAGFSTRNFMLKSMN